MSDPNRKPSVFGRYGLAAAQAAQAALGGVVGYLLASNAAALDLPWEDGLAISIGLALALMAVVGGVVMLRRPADVPRDCAVLQIIVLLLAGGMLAAPVLVPATVPPVWVFAGIAALFLLQTIANILLWMRSDELMRRVIADTSVWTFWPLQGALFLFAVAERLSLVESISAWAMTGILMSVYLLASLYVTIRRGLT